MRVSIKGSETLMDEDLDTINKTNNVIVCVVMGARGPVPSSPPDETVIVHKTRYGYITC